MEFVSVDTHGGARVMNARHQLAERGDRVRAIVEERSQRAVNDHGQD